MGDPIRVYEDVEVAKDSRLDVLICSDKAGTTPKDIHQAVTVEVHVDDPANGWTIYPATIDDDGTAANTGKCHITLTAANHTTPGTAEVRAYANGELQYPRYQITFIASAS